MMPLANPNQNPNGAEAPELKVKAVNQNSGEIMSQQQLLTNFNTLATFIATLVTPSTGLITPSNRNVRSALRVKSFYKATLINI